MAPTVNKLSFYFSKLFKNYNYAIINKCVQLYKSNRNTKITSSLTVKDYLKSKPCLLQVKDFLPNQFLKQKIYPSYYTFVADDEVADAIFKLIKNDVKGCDIAEGCAGLGLLTKRLVAKANSLFLFDPRPVALEPLQKVINSNRDKLVVVPSLFYNLQTIIVQDEKDGGDRFGTIFSKIICKDWSDEPALKLITVLHSSNILRFIARSICFQTNFLKLGRIEYFFLIMDVIYKRLIPEKCLGRIHNHVVLNALFDIKELGQFPRMAFLPWDKGKGADMQDRRVHLVQITPKANLFQLYSPEELRTLWYFIHEFTRSKESLIIGVFENLVPGSGIKLIHEGVNPMMRVNDISVNEIVHLFHVFISLPDFDALDFLHIQETSCMQDLGDEIPEKIDELQESLE